MRDARSRLLKNSSIAGSGEQSLTTITSPCNSLREQSSDSRHALTAARPEYTGIIMSTTRVEAPDATDLSELLNVEPSMRSRDSSAQSKITTSQSPARESRREGVVGKHIAQRSFLDFAGGGMGHVFDELYIVRNPPLSDLAIEIGFQFIRRGLLTGCFDHDQ